MGIFFALLGTGVLAIMYYNMQVNLNCRDCQGGGGILLLIFGLVEGGFFLCGFIIGMVISFRLKKNKQASIRRDMSLYLHTHSNPVTDSKLTTNPITNTNLKMVI